MQRQRDPIVGPITDPLVQSYEFPKQEWKEI